jgi:glycosyltransferase involved in cell wall biosynthesis
MRIVYLWRHSLTYEYVMTNVDGHFETFAYLSRYYDVELMLPSPTPGDFSRDGYRVTLRPSVNDLLLKLQAEPADAVVCYGPFNEPEWPLVRQVAGNAFFVLDYAGGPFCDVNGLAWPSASQFDAIFVAHETQAVAMRALGYPAVKARGVPTSRFAPQPVQKLWHVFYPATFSPAKRHPLVAQYCEQYAPEKPSLFCGWMEPSFLGYLEMARVGGIPLNKPGALRNGIQFGCRAPYAAMPLLYSASEVVIVGSQEEGGPWAALEAMACGTPAIVMADCKWQTAEAFQALADEFPGSCVVADPLPTAIHAAVEALRMVPPERPRSAIVSRYDWFRDQYDVTDRTIKNGVAFKMAGRPEPA